VHQNSSDSPKSPFLEHSSCELLSLCTWGHTPPLLKLAILPRLVIPRSLDVHYADLVYANAMRGVPTVLRTRFQRDRRRSAGRTTDVQRITALAVVEVVQHSECADPTHSQAEYQTGIGQWAGEENDD